MCSLKLVIFLHLLLLKSSLAEDGCGDDCFKNSKGKCECGMSGTISSSCERSPRTGKCTGCFHGNSTVLLESGQAMQMDKLIIGDMIQTSSEEFYPFLGWLERMPDTETVFLTLHTEMSSITLTPTHIIFVKYGAKTVTKYARDVSILDELINKDGKPEVVSRITKSVSTGYYSPLTEPGTIVVDGLLTSCFASFPHELANMVLYPVRKWPSVFLGTDGGPGTYIKLVKTLGTFMNIRDAAIPAMFVRDFAKQEF